MVDCRELVKALESAKEPVRGVATESEAPEMAGEVAD